MDKTTYETYEYLPADAAEPSAEQYFVVEEDNTFLINRQVQYVSEVRDVKQVLGVVQPCTMYDVSSQQYFGDVDNATELISVSDQFMLPEHSGTISAESNLYNSSYLLQAAPSGNMEQMEVDVVGKQFKEPAPEGINIDAEAQSNTLGNNFTEITITDEQYKTLEAKGWLLLEINDKLFILNSLGLHDITSDQKLVQKLKSEMQNQNVQTDSGLVDLNQLVVLDPMPNILPESESIQEPEEFKPTVTSEQEESDTLQDAHGPMQDAHGPLQDAQSPVEENVTEIQSEKPMTIAEESDQQLLIKTEPTESVKTDPPKASPKCLKIKTKLSFKDIPDKVYLGKTVNGKRLVAKVVKRLVRPNKEVQKPKIQELSIANELSGTGLLESEYVKLLQHAIRGLDNMCSAIDVGSAQSVVAQLLKLPNVKDTLLEHTITVTMVSNCVKDSLGAIVSKGKTKLVTGRIVNQDGGYNFEHAPDLLLNIAGNLGSRDETPSDTKLRGSKENVTLFHIHIAETTGSDNIVRYSVMLNKRHLPVKLLLNLKRIHAQPMFACSACAVTFDTEEQLTTHQQNDCWDTEDVLAIETEKPNPYTILQGPKGRLYSCTLCNMTFQKLSNCQSHVKSHRPPTEKAIDDGVNRKDSEKKSTVEVYKCKMCPSIYFHPATLTKHIVTKHINVNSGKL